MDVLGIREVGEEGEDAAECSPVTEDAEGFGVRGSEEVGDRGGKGLKYVAAFGGDLRCGSDGAAANVKEDEGGDDERVARDFGSLNVFVKERSGVEAEVPAAGKSEAAYDQRYDAEKNQEAEDVGEEVVGCTDGVGGGDAEWRVAFEGIDEVDEAVEDEAVEDERVEKSDGRAFLERALLGECRDERVDEAAREIVEARFGVGGAAADAQVEAIKTSET